MNRAQRRAFAATQRGPATACGRPAPAYGRPADLFRALAPLGVTVKVVRGHGTFRLDYLMPAAREVEARAILAAFPSGEAWDVGALAVLAVVTGEMFKDMPRGSSAHLSLVKLLAEPVDDPLAQHLLRTGARH